MQTSENDVDNDVSWSIRQLVYSLVTIYMESRALLDPVYTMSDNCLSGQKVIRIGSPFTRAKFIRIDIYPLSRTNIYPATKAI